MTMFGNSPHGRNPGHIFISPLQYYVSLKNVVTATISLDYILFQLLGLLMYGIDNGLGNGVCSRHLPIFIVVD